MRTKKPALDIKEGVFYTGIPGYSIKVNEKIGDEQLKDIIIYDHTNASAQGNTKVILADSGRMYSFMNQRYLALELYRGSRYEEGVSEKYEEKVAGGQFVRDKFSSSRMFFDLSSFDMGDTDENLFRRSRLVQTREQLISGIDSMQRDIHLKEEQMFNFVANTFTYHYVKDAPVPDQIMRPKAYYDSLRQARREVKRDDDDSLNIVESPEERKLVVVENKQVLNNQQNGGEIEVLKSAGASMGTESAQEKDKTSIALTNTFEENMRRFDSYYKGDGTRLSNALTYGVNKSRSARNVLNSRVVALESVKRDQRKFVVTQNQQIARSFACLLMFLIGAPIGAIIKKGGLGLPVIVSVVFFLIYYTLNTTGDKWGKQGVLDPAIAVWISNAALLPFGLFFLRQARNDASLFELDFYVGAFEKIKNLFKKKKN